MALGIGFGAERLGIFALKFPKVATLCLLTLAVLIGLSLPRVSFDDDIHRSFLSDSALSKAQLDYDASLSPPLSTVLVHITSPVALTATDMKVLRNLALDLEFGEGVTAVTSPFVLRWPPDPENPSGRPLFAEQIEDGFVQDLADFRALETGLPTSLDDALTAMILGVSVDVAQASVTNAVADIQAEVDRALPNALSATITGEDVISAEIVAGLKDDLISLNLWGALIITIAAFVFLRDLRMAVLAVVPAIFGASGVLALTVWLGYPVTVLSNVIPILLLVLGVADGVHLTDHLKEDGSAQNAVESVGPACALTALTTAVAFASIMLTGNAQLYEFAVLGALGTLFSFAIVIVTFALMARIVPLGAKPVPQFSTRMACHLTRTGRTYPRTVIVISAMLLAFTTYGFMQTKAWFPLYQNLPDNSPMLATNDAIAQDFGGVFQMIIETQGEWADIRNIAQQLEALNGSQTVLSELNFARWLGHADTAPSPEELETLPDTLIDRLGGKNGISRIFVSVPEPMRNEQTLAQFDALYDTATNAGADRIIGLPTMMRFEAVNLIAQLSVGLIVAALGATLLVAVAFRSLRLVTVLIVPNVLPLMLTGASLHLWAHGQLSPTAVLALTIAFGIAIDDTVHFLSRFFAARQRGVTVGSALESATLTAGRVMVLTTVLLTAGIGVTLLSDFTPIRQFGGMLMITLWAALLTDLLLLPALLSWREPVHVSG